VVKGGLPIFYGWVVVVTITTMLMATNGARLLFGVVLKPLSEEFGWQRSDLTFAILVNMVVLSIVQPFGGWLTDRVGPKRVLVGGTGLIALTLIPFSFSRELWQVYVIYGLVGGIAFTAASPVNASTLVNRWFDRRRGTALSIAMAGTPVGQLIIVPIAAVILEATDWQTLYRVLALLLVLMVPIGAWLLKSDPAEIGEVPEGRRSPTGLPSDPERDGRSGAAALTPALAVEREATLGEALRSPGFWLLAYGFLVCGFTMGFASLHFLAYADDMGMHTSVATTAVSVTAIFSVIGTVVLGVIADRTDRAPVLALTYLLRGVAFLLLYAFESGPLVYAYAVVLGVSWSATTPLTAAIACDIYGRKNLGAIFGTMFTSMNLGFGIGAYLDGVIYDAVGEYHSAIAINGLAGLSAALAIYLFSLRRTPSHRPIAIGEPAAAAPAPGD
jgi:MFS family permease